MTQKGRLKTFAQNCGINITRKWFKFTQKSQTKAVWLRGDTDIHRCLNWVRKRRQSERKQRETAASERANRSKQSISCLDKLYLQPRPGTLCSTTPASACTTRTHENIYTTRRMESFLGQSSLCPRFVVCCHCFQMHAASSRSDGLPVPLRGRRRWRCF